MDWVTLKGIYWILFVHGVWLGVSSVLIVTDPLHFDATLYQEIDWMGMKLGVPAMALQFKFQIDNIFALRWDWNQQNRQT